MKKIISLVVLCSFSAFACEELIGKYECEDNKFGAYSVEVNKNDKGYFIKKVNSLVGDLEDIGIDSKFYGKCQSSILTTQSSIEFDNYSIKINESYRKTESGILIIKHKVTNGKAKVEYENCY